MCTPGTPIFPENVRPLACYSDFMKTLERRCQL